MQTHTRLFTLSAFILFLELVLIRWIGTEVSIFAYLQNAILICCFLGLGLGCMTKPESAPLHKTFERLAVLATLLSIPFLREQMLNIGALLSTCHDFVVWHQAYYDDLLGASLRFSLGSAATFILAGIIWKLMVALGAYLAELFDQAKNPITAYSINILGSLVGIWLFSLLSVLSLPPAAWLFVLVALALPLVYHQSSFHKIGYVWLLLILTLPLVGIYLEKAEKVVWSPYQKLALLPVAEAPTEYRVMVNNTGYQDIQNNSREYIQAHHPELLGATGSLSQYDIPGRLVPDADDILVVGAGTGNDVAGALRTTKGRITAVEIDPAILAFGREFHPERPYDSARVDVIVDDARAVFMQMDKKFDLIVFGLLDSHSTPALTNARLDHYVYTLEALTQASLLLKPDGVLVLIFQPQREYVALRLAQTLQKVFGAVPLSLIIPNGPLGWGGTLFIAGGQAQIQRQLAKDSELAQFLEKQRVPGELLLREPIRSITDNWPYLYVKEPSIPILFIALGCMLVLLGYQSKREVLAGRRWKDLISQDMRPFMAMGAGFSLFEVYGVNQAAILFGSSWFVNSIVISSILSMIVVANIVQQKFSLLPYGRAVMLALVVVLLGIYSLNLSHFISFGMPLKICIAVIIFGGPMLLSGIVFAALFEGASEKGLALGTNLLGALIGGALQLATFLLGINSLLLFSAAAYIITLLTLGKRKTSAS